MWIHLYHLPTRPFQAKVNFRRLNKYLPNKVPILSLFSVGTTGAKRQTLFNDAVIASIIPYSVGGR
jgi:hypothetical protein